MNSYLSNSYASSPIMESIERSMNFYDRLSNVTVRSVSLSKRFDLPLVYDGDDINSKQVDHTFDENCLSDGQRDLLSYTDVDAANRTDDGDTCDDQPAVKDAAGCLDFHESSVVTDVDNDERLDDSDDCENDECGDSLDEDSDDVDETDCDPGQKMILKFLRGMNSDINARLNEIENKITKTENETTKIPSLEKQIAEANHQNEILKSEIDSLKIKYDELHERQLVLDSYNRKDNLVFHGVPFIQNENCGNKLREIMKTYMKIDPNTVDKIGFHRCHRLPGKGDRGIICQFSNGDQRDMIWEKRFSLKQSKIFVVENFPAEIESRRRKLYPIARIARSKKMKALVKYDKLIINGTQFDYNRLDKLPDDLRPPPSTLTKNGVTCFFGGDSPLSNFYVVEEGIVIDGVRYDCVERYFQQRKAQFADRPEAVSRIKNAKTASQCKGIGDSLTVDNNKWFPVAKDTMFKACLAKFSQHQSLKEFLLNTEDTTLAEAGPNKVWGIGLRSDQPDAFVKDNWQGLNTLGVVMMDVRKKLRTGHPNFCQSPSERPLSVKL